MSHLFLSLPPSLLPSPFLLTVLNLLYRVRACISDSRFFLLSAGILSVRHHVQLVLVFNTGSKHHFSSAFAELLPFRVHHSYCAWEVGWDFRGVP